MNLLELSAYFQRIGLQEWYRRSEGELPRTGETLSRIQCAQLHTVPYENLDILRGKPLSLREEDLFRKIVTEHRGGYCFEVNGLLSHVYRDLGFSVTDCAGRVFMGELAPSHRRHRVLLVQAMDGIFFCDAGMNRESQRTALRLEPGLIQTDGVAEYKVERDGFYGWILYQRLPGRDFWPVYAFTEEPQLDTDFEMPSFWCEKSPASPLNTFIRASVMRDGSHYLLKGDRFSRFAAGAVQEEQLLSPAEAAKCLDTVFGIAGVTPEELERYPKS